MITASREFTFFGGRKGHVKRRHSSPILGMPFTVISISTHTKGLQDITAVVVTARTMFNMSDSDYGEARLFLPRVLIVEEASTST